MQNYEILEHTGDVKIKAYGKSKEELFQNAMEWMFKILNPKSKGQNPKQRSIEIQSSDLNALLVDFLSEVNYLRQTNMEMYNKVRFTKFSDMRLKGEIEGYEIEEFGEDIKAVTFHKLDIRQNKEGIWETSIIFDV